jgi:integrase
MSGHIRRRGQKSWELKFEVDRDPTTGARKIQYVTHHGSKRSAQAKLTELLAAVGKGTYVAPSRTVVSDFVRARIDQWEAAGDITARTAQRYR